MLRRSIFVLLSLPFVSLTAFGAQKSLRCQVADEANTNEKAVTVTTIVGAEIVDPVVTQYGDHKIVVVHQRGDEFDSQTVLTMTVDGVTSQTYNLSEASLYQQLGKGYFLQCWFE